MLTMSRSPEGREFLMATPRLTRTISGPGLAARIAAAGGFGSTVLGVAGRYPKRPISLAESGRERSRKEARSIPEPRSRK
jgi:hypothetical protein